jgi:hypothetical protein
MKKVEAYKCDFCGRLLKSRAGAMRHEPTCDKNPANDRACFHCQHLEMRTRCAYVTGHNSFCEVTKERDVEIFVCKKRNIHVIPPKRHVALKMRYNSLRPHKHGKNY